jgi:phage shock protein B
LLKIVLLLFVVALGCLVVAPLAVLTVRLAWSPRPVHAFAAPSAWLNLSVLAGPLLLVGVVCAVLLFALLAVKALSGVPGRGETAGAEEVRLMQELHGALSGLERRVEALETILMERREAER